MNDYTQTKIFLRCQLKSFVIQLLTAKTITRKNRNSRAFSQKTYHTPTPGLGPKFIKELKIIISHEIKFILLYSAIYRTIILRMVKYTVYQTEEYNKWFKMQNLKSQRQVLHRVSMIETDGHFGHYKRLINAGIWELKFNDGRRIYYALVIEQYKVILLFGGNKNGQEKDIKKASALYGTILKARPR
jgi:putative addiction module killer protein